MAENAILRCEPFRTVLNGTVARESLVVEIAILGRYAVARDTWLHRVSSARCVLCINRCVGRYFYTLFRTKLINDNIMNDSMYGTKRNRSAMHAVPCTHVAAVRVIIPMWLQCAANRATVYYGNSSRSHTKREKLC